MEYKIGQKVRLVEPDDLSLRRGYKVGDILEIIGIGKSWKKDIIQDKKKYWFYFTQIEPITEFKVGDKIRCYYDDGKSEIGIIRHIGSLKKSGGILLGDKNSVWSDWGRGWREDFDILTYFNSTTTKIELLNKEDTMSLKSRIEAITGESSLKEVDDIIVELGDDCLIKFYSQRHNDLRTGEITVFTKGLQESKSDIKFTDQCSKFTALKDALMWLYEKSTSAQKEKDNVELVELERKFGEKIVELSAQFKKEIEEYKRGTR